MPLQVSAEGASGSQLAGSQLVPVAAQEPTPQVVSASPSSTWPSQSLSAPSHTSSAGTQTLQSKPSSVCPSQSLSSSSQISGALGWIDALPSLQSVSSVT